MSANERQVAEHARQTDHTPEVEWKVMMRRAKQEAEHELRSVHREAEERARDWERGAAT